MKNHAYYQRIIFIFFTLTTAVLLALSLLENISDHWINTQRQHDCGASALLSFSKPLTDKQLTFIRDQLKNIPFSEQKSFATTAFQGDQIFIVQSHVLYDSYPLTQPPLKLNQNSLLVNKALSDRLTLDPITVGQLTFDSWQTIGPSFYWNMMEVIWPMIWLTPEQLNKTDLLAQSSRYHTDFYIGTTSLPPELQKFVDSVEGLFETYLEQENIISELIASMNVYVNWFFVALVFMQTLGLWLLFIKEQDLHRPMLFYYQWYKLPWPFFKLLINRTLLIFTLILIAIGSVGMFINTFAQLHAFYTIFYILAGQWLLVLSLLILMSFPFSYKTQYRFTQLIIALCLGICWSSFLNADLSSWLLCFGFIISGLMMTSLVLWFSGWLFSLGSYWPIGLLGRYWQRKALTYSWPQAALVATLTLMVLAIHLHIAFSNLIQQPLDHQENFFAINLPLDSSVKLNQIKLLNEYNLLRPKILSIDGEHVKQSRTDQRPGRPGMYRPLDCIIADSIPNNDLLAEGAWPQYSKEQPYPLLIEQSFAKKMDIKLGSILKFDMGVSPVYGKAVAFHQAHWQSMQPSFFIIFPPNSVENFLESKMITGFVAQKDKNDVFRSIARAYPSTTFFDVDEIKNIAQQLIIPILHICIFLLTAFLITMALFSTFIQALYPMKLLPVALEKALLGSKSTSLEQFSRRLEHLILTIFIMILCKVIFTYVKWSSLGLKELDFTYLSLLLCIVITYFLLSHTELKKSQEG